MHVTVDKALVAMALVTLALAWSVRRVRRMPGLGTGLQVVGAFALLIVVVAHLCEGLALFPSMGWGQPHSVGHYLDLFSAIVGVTLIPVGSVLGRRGQRR